MLDTMEVWIYIYIYIYKRTLCMETLFNECDAMLKYTSCASCCNLLHLATIGGYDGF